MPQIEGLQRVQQLLQKKLAKAGVDKNASVTVGFTMNYAVHVHENLTAKHPVGQAKYLEQPARRLSNSGKLGEIIRKVYEAIGSIRTGLFEAGIQLQGDAEKLTPVDTSALRSSAFTAFTENEDAAAEAAFNKGQAIRKAALKHRAKQRRKK